MATALPTYSCIVKPNTHDLSTASCQQFLWLDHTSPTSPYKRHSTDPVGRVLHISGPPDGVGNPSQSEFWFAQEVMFQQTPEGISSWAKNGSGGHYINLHSVGGDVGWLAPYLVSPILISVRSPVSGTVEHLLELPHNNNNTLDNGTGAIHWDLPVPTLDVWCSILVRVVFGRAKDYAAAGTPQGRVQIWINASDGSIISPSNGNPTLDTSVHASQEVGVVSAVNTLIRDTANSLNQQYVEVYEGLYNPTGYSNVTNPFPNQTSACKTCANSGGCVNGLLDRHFYFKKTALRIGTTLAGALGDTSITLYQNRHSSYAANASPNYGDSTYTVLTGGNARTTDTFILSLGLDGKVGLPTIASFTPTSGTSSTSVTITGTNFTGTTAVKFNGTPTTFVVNSSTQITAPVPTGATTGPIQATNAIGDGVSSTNFTVTGSSGAVLPAPAAGHVRIGNSLVGAYTTGILPDTKRVIKRNVGAGQQVRFDQGYSLEIGPTSGSNEAMRMVIYDDDGAGNLPGTLLGFSEEVTVLQGAAAQWVSFPFTTTVDVNGGVSGDVYFGIHFGGPGSVSFNYQSVTGTGWRGTDVYSNGPDTPFGTPTVINVEPACVADYFLAPDTSPPVLIAATAVDTAVLTFSEPLDETSIPLPSSFNLTVNNTNYQIASVAVLGSTVTLAFTPALVLLDVITVSYADPGPSGAQILDLAGNNLASFFLQPVTNNIQPALPLGRRIDPASRIIGHVRRVDASHRIVGGGGGGL